MPIKGSGPATDWTEVNRWDHGTTWIAYPDEEMQRASHVIEVDGDVWLVDPVDADGIDDLFDEFGTVTGVVVLIDRHKRDAANVARRHGVSVHLPEIVAGVADDIDAPTETVHRELGDTGYGIHTVVDNPIWHEVALYGEDTGTLVVPEAVGTGDFFRARGERLGVSPALRLFPPKRLARFDPERLLVGHGPGITDDPKGALETALDGSRKRAPGLYADIARSFLTG